MSFDLPFVRLFGNFVITLFPSHFVPVLPIDNTRITLNGKTNAKINGKVDEIEHDITKNLKK
jgi:hypothetical protein